MGQSKILVIDDEEVIRNLLADTLTDEGYEVTTVANGEEGYQEAMKHYFAKDFSATQSLLFKVLQKNPNDKVAWHHLMNTTRNLENGVSEIWTGVNVMTSK